MKVLGIKDPRQIVLEDVAMTENIFVVEDNLSGAEARLVRRGSRGIVRVSRNIREAGRKRFAIAHEIGHWILHSASGRFTLCTSDDVATFNNVDLELEANAFAGELLMPSAMFAPRCREVDLENVARLSDEFRTTLTAASIRFVEECPAQCAVVFSLLGKIKWYRVKEGSPIKFRSGALIRPKSVSNVASDAPVKSADVSTWFPDGFPGQPRPEVYEQSVKLGEYGTVLTLLSIVSE